MKVCFEFVNLTFSINCSFIFELLGCEFHLGPDLKVRLQGANYHYGNRLTGWVWVELECKEMFLTSFLTNAAQLYHFTDLNKLGIKNFTLVYFFSTLKPEFENVATNCPHIKITNVHGNCLVFSSIS